MSPEPENHAVPRVAIDARKWNDFGIGTYIQGLVSGLTELVSEPGHPAAGLHYILLTRDGRWPSSASRPAGFSSRPADTQPYSFAELFHHDRAIRAAGVDLYHSTHYPLPLRVSTPTVVTIHDLIHLLPGTIPGSALRRAVARLYASWMLRHAMRRSHAVITVSEHTRRGLMERFDATLESVTVAPNGVAREFFERPAQPDPETPAQYVLLVGNPKPHKNLDRALQAFSRCPDGLSLVVVGAESAERKAIEDRCRELDIERRVVHLGRVQAGRLPALYAHARVFLFPSLHEGFGLPALEAMAAGVAVVAADAASIPEVTGDTALLVDPTSVQQMADAVTRLHREPELRQELIEQAGQRARQFSWRAAAEKTVEVYRRALAASEAQGDRGAHR